MEIINKNIKVKICVNCGKDDTETKFQQYMKRCMTCNNKQFREKNVNYHKVYMQTNYIKIEKKERKPKVVEIKTIENINIECKLCSWMCEYPQCHTEYSKNNCEYINNKYDISYGDNGEINLKLKNI